MPTSFIMWFELGSCCLRCWSHAMQQSCCLNESFRIQPRHSRRLMSWLASCLVRMESEWTPKKMWKSPCCGTEPSTEGEGTLICMAFPLPLRTKLPGALHRKASEVMDGWMQVFCAHQKPFWSLHSRSGQEYLLLSFPERGLRARQGSAGRWGTALFSIVGRRVTPARRRQKGILPHHIWNLNSTCIVKKPWASSGSTPDSCI